MSSKAETLSPRTLHARTLFSGLPRTYDLMARLLSFGQDPRWRRFMVSCLSVPVQGQVLDVATGTGAVAIEVARRTGSRVVGLDQSEPMVRTGVRVVSQNGLRDRVSFILGQGERLPFPDETFDAVTFTYLLRYVEDPGLTLSEMTRVLRPGGTLANLEFHVPEKPIWRSLWGVYTTVGLPLVGRMVSRSWFEVGKFLGPSISEFYRRYPLGHQLGLWRAAGVTDAQARVMSLGGGVVIWGTKRAGGTHG